MDLNNKFYKEEINFKNFDFLSKPLIIKLNNNFSNILSLLLKPELIELSNLIKLGPFFFNSNKFCNEFFHYFIKNNEKILINNNQFENKNLSILLEDFRNDIQNIKINFNIFEKQENNDLFLWFINSLKFSKINLNFDLKEKHFLNLFNQDELFDNSIDFLEKQLNLNTITLTDDNIVDIDNSGRVISFIDSIVIIEGLQKVKSNELLYFSGGSTGLALNLEYNRIKALVFTNSISVMVGELVYSSGYVMKVGVGEELLGRVINPLNKPLDGLSEINFESYNVMERKAPGVITRKKVSEPVVTGIKIIDALVPIGKGQRELILGDRKTGKTTIVVDTILNQKLAFENQINDLICVYVAIGKRMSEIVRIVKILKQNSALDYTVIIVARASDPASLQFIAPYVGCTIAEYFTYKGDNSLIIYDDLTKHADVYRQISLLLRRPVGREAYPGDVFFLHSRLLERAVKMNINYGNGSLTALPIIETIQGDVSAYIPTNVISITDGQIYLDLNKHQEGIRPAVDPGISVSRVGSSAQTKMMKKLAGSLKLDLAQYKEVEQFSKFGSELDASTKYLLMKGKLLINLLKQPRNVPLDLAKQIMVLFLPLSNIIQNLNFELLNLDNYLNSLYKFVSYSNIFLPFKFTIENFNLNEGCDLNWLLNIHYSFFLFKNFNKNKINLDYNFSKIEFHKIFLKNFMKFNFYSNISDKNFYLNISDKNFLTIF